MSITLDFSADFAVFDNKGTVSIQSREGGDPVSTAAIRRWITTREAQASDGKYTSDDVTFHISGVSLGITPTIGDTITEGSTGWTILAVRYERLTDRWELVSRELAVSGLNTLVTIQLATFTRTMDGIQQATWADELTDLRAAFQLFTGDDIEENKLQELKPQYRCYLTQTIETKNRRLLHDGNLYRIKAHADSNRIDALFELTLEDW